jgi:hypothetical protein
MDNCDHCSELLLDYLYDLLDEAQADELRVHLDVCASCQLRLARAESQQQLIATAARLYQSVPAFAPPVTMPAETSICADTLALGPETLANVPAAPARPVAVRRKPVKVLAWLSLAAGVLIAVGLGLTYSAYRNGVAEREDAVQAALRQGKLIDSEFAELKSDLARKVAATPQGFLKQELHVQVVGPAVIQPQNGNIICVNTTDLTGRAVGADVTVRLKDEQTGKLIATSQVEGAGPLAVVLAPQRLTKPGTKWQLEVEAAAPGRATEIFLQSVQVAAPRYVTQVVTSKPVYETGELLFFRTLTLDQVSHKPPQRSFWLNYSLLNSAGTVVKTLTGPSQLDGIGGGEFALSEDLADGTYTLLVEDAMAGVAGDYTLAPQSFPVHIRQPLTPKVVLDQNLVPGKKVNFNFEGGKAAANQPVIVSLSGKKGKSNGTVKTKDKDQGGDKQYALKKELEQLRADDLGKAQGAFMVPKEFSPKELAELEFQVVDGKLNQKFTQCVPVVEAGWHVSFFPECGHLVAGLPNRVYCQVAAPALNAQALTGELCDAAGTVMATFSLGSHQSRESSDHLSGVFELTPKSGAGYKVRVRRDKDAEPEIQKSLPPAEKADLTMSVANPVDAATTPLQLKLHSSKANYPVLVVASCRGQFVGQQLSLAQPAGESVELATASEADGVIRLTAYHPTGAGLVPLAERLVYRIPEKKLTLSFKPKHKKITTGQKAELLVESHDENRSWTSSTVLALVVEEHAGPAKNSAAQWNLPAFFYFAGPVQQPADLENAAFLLGPEPAAHQALDRFLAIEGGRSLAAGTGGTAPPAMFCGDNLDLAQDRYLDLVASHTKKLHEHFGAKQADLQSRKDQANAQVRLAELALADFEAQGRLWLGIGLSTVLLVALGMGLAFFVVGVWRVMRSLPAARRYFTAAFVSLAACMLFAGVLTAFRSENLTMGHTSVKLDAPGALDAPPELPSAKQLAAQSLPKFNSLPNDVFQRQAAGQPVDSSKGESTTESSSPANKDTKASEEKFADQDGKHDKAKKDAKEPAPSKTYWLKTDRPTSTAKGGGTGLKEIDSYSNIKNNKRYQDAVKLQTMIMAQAEKAKQDSGKPDTGLKTKTPGDSRPPSFPDYYGPAPVTEPVTANPGPGGNFGGLAGQSYPYGLSQAGNFAQQFSHQNPQQGAFRADTLLWYPNLNIENGVKVIDFDVPPYAATYRVLLIGNDAAGRLGFYEGTLKVKAK